MSGDPHAESRPLSMELAATLADEILTDLGTTRPAAQERPAPTPPLVADVPASPLQHQVLAGYELISVLGKGGMAVVYRARDLASGKTVALKVFDAATLEPALRREFLERFHLEASTVARLGRHPHLVQVHDFGSEGDVHYCSMDLVEGATLDAWRKAAPRTVREVVSILHRIALGLAHAHAHGLVHRDVKPANVFVGHDGQPRLGDFGLVRDLTSTFEVTHPGEVMGTPHYMAPEQAMGDRARIGPWTDVYTLGVTLYEATCGVLPFEGGNESELLASIVHDPPIHPVQRDPQFPQELEAIILKCLEKEPSRRYGDAAALAIALERWLRR